MCVCVSEEGGREGGGGRRGADTELKTKTPHVNVGKNRFGAQLDLPRFDNQKKRRERSSLSHSAEAVILDSIICCPAVFFCLICICMYIYIGVYIHLYWSWIVRTYT